LVPSPGEAEGPDDCTKPRPDCPEAGCELGTTAAGGGLLPKEPRETGDGTGGAETAGGPGEDATGWVVGAG